MTAGRHSLRIGIETKVLTLPTNGIGCYAIDLVRSLLTVLTGKNRIRNQRRQRTAEAIAEQAGDTQDHSGCHLDELPGTVKRPWADTRCQEESKLWGETAPDPLPPVLTQVVAFPIGVGLLCLLALDAVRVCIWPCVCGNVLHNSTRISDNGRG